MGIGDTEKHAYGDESILNVCNCTEQLRNEMGLVATCHCKKPAPEGQRCGDCLAKEHVWVPVPEFLSE